MRPRARRILATLAVLALGGGAAALAQSASSATLPVPPSPSGASPADPVVPIPTPPGAADSLSSSGGLPVSQPGADSSALASILGSLPNLPTTAPPIAGAGSSPSPAPAHYVPDPGAPASDLTGCNPLDPSVCLYPFPSDYYTRADSGTPTGRRLAIRLLALPRNIEGKPIDNTELDRLDGFSPGDPIVVKVPGLDNATALDRTAAAPVNDIQASLQPDQPVVVINTKTRKRQLIWTEIDSTASTPAATTLIISPGANFDYGTTYIVALRNLRDSAGNVLQPNSTFQALRDDLPSTDPFVLRERAHYDSMLRLLQRAGVARKSLYLAWDFTVGSAQSITGRMLHIRNDAFAQLGDTNLADGKVQGAAPTYKITKVTDNPSPQILRQIDGYVTVPCYLDVNHCLAAHAQFVLDSNGMPLQLRAGTPAANKLQAKFECRIPASAVQNGQVVPSHLSLYGHGLFGSYSEVEAGNVTNMSDAHDFTYCATDWIGMATNDVPNALTALLDLSNFNTLVDRLQQGFLDFLYLGRLMIHPAGLVDNPDFQYNGKPLIDTSALYYDGNSQGGIFGGALTAISTDFKRAVLGVPAMNYSTLLTRSSDFGTGTPPDIAPTVPPNTGDAQNVSYAYPLYTSYPQEISRPLIFALIQLMWDRADPDGYAARMTSDPLPDTPPHRVLMELAFGDHQVSNWAAEVEARTIGAHAVTQELAAPGRSNEVVPYYGIPAFGSLPANSGSGFEVWDSGTNPDPPLNTAPVDGSGRANHDPHEDPRADPKNQLQKAIFLTTGQIVDTCGGPCFAGGYTGP